MSSHPLVARQVQAQGTLHVAVGPEAEGERQMLFDLLDQLRRGDVLILDRGYPASWLVQALAQRGIDSVSYTHLTLPTKA